MNMKQQQLCNEDTFDRMWTNSSEQDQTGAHFSSVEVAAFMLRTYIAVKQNGLT